MIDFHSHILPEMDDGAEDLETSLEMLRESRRQGVDIICSTSHFYADEEDPESFLTRRSDAYERLQEAVADMVAGRWKKGNIPDRWDGRSAERIIQILT